MSGVICPEGIYQILARLVEIASSVRHVRDIRDYESVRPIAVSVRSAVIHGILHGPDGFRPVFVLRFRSEIVMEIGFQIHAAGRHDGLFRINDDLSQVILADFRHPV